MEDWCNLSLVEIVKSREPDFKFQYSEDLPLDSNDIDTYIPAYIYKNYILIDVGIRSPNIDVYEFIDSEMVKVYETEPDGYITEYFWNMLREAYIEYVLTKEMENEINRC